MNEALAGYLACLADWEIMVSQSSYLLPENPDKNFYLLKCLHIWENMNQQTISQGALYEQGRPVMKSMPIVYKKGPIFVHKLAKMMGGENFQLAMQDYVNNYYLKTANHEQLWEVMENQKPPILYDYNVSQIFNSWIKQSGVPYLNVSRCYEDDCRNKLEFGQKEFSFNPDATSTKTWNIPIRYSLVRYNETDDKYVKQSGDPLRFLMMNKTHIQYNIDTIGEKDALIVNSDHAGMYHVNYDETNWKNIGAVLHQDPKLITPATRLQLAWLLRLSLEREEIRPSMVLCIGEYTKVTSTLYLYNQCFFLVFV